MKFREMLEKNFVPKELLEVIKDKEKASDYFSDNLLYNGENIFVFYMDFLNWFEKNTKNLKNETWTEEFCDDVEDEESGEWYEDCYDEDVSRSKQEVYLGYLPSKDLFVTCFDVWEGDDSAAGIVYWSYNKKFKIHDENIDYSGHVYSKFGLFGKIHKKHKDLVDIRLD